MYLFKLDNYQRSKEKPIPYVIIWLKKDITDKQNNILKAIIIHEIMREDKPWSSKSM